jgi:rare lipoprotein A
MPSTSRSGGYYLDDGPGDAPPANLDLLPDPEPRVEPYATFANRPYNVFGLTYVPKTSDTPFKQRGMGSWYGRRFHGQKTSSGETYNMYALTAAHPTLPIPSYARVTNVANGRSVIVRVNDRGPFHAGRVMDLSFAAATRLGYVGQGSAFLDIERILPREIADGTFKAQPQDMSAPDSTPAVAAIGSPLSASAEAGGAPPASLDPTIPPDLLPEAAAALPSRSATNFEGPEYARAGAPSPGLTAVLPEIDRTRIKGSRLAKRYLVQLGAFRAQSSAQDFIEQVSLEVDPSLAQRLLINPTTTASGTWYRVQLGPYTYRTDAEADSESLRRALRAGLGGIRAASVIVTEP